MGEVVGAVAGIAQVAGAFLPPPFNFIAAAGGFALSAVSGSLAGQSRPRTRALNVTLPSAAQDRIRNIRSSVDSHVAVYGTARVGIRPWICAESGGSDNRFLHLVGPVAGHLLDDIVELWLDDEVIRWAEDILPPEHGEFGGVIHSSNRRFTMTAQRIAEDGALVRAFKHLGGDDQAADAKAVAELENWTAAHQGLGIAYVYLRLQYNKTAFAGGVPEASVIVQGRKVWDPRDEEQEPEAPESWGFSNNWALCVLDYLRADFGLAAALDEIDLPSFVAAANIADEPVALEAGESPATQARYLCDGVIDLDEKPIEIMEDLLSAGAGGLSYSQGRYHLFAGAYVTPTRSLGMDDLAGPVEVQTRPERRVLFNAVRGTYVSPVANYQPTDFPPRSNATFEAEDGDAQIFRDIELPFTDDAIRAQRIAEIHLRKARQGITVTFPAKLTALDLAVFDTVSVTLDSAGAALGWTDKAFRVMAWSFSPGGGIDLTLQEETPESYDWEAGDAQLHDPAPDTTLPKPYEVAAPEGVSLESGSAQLLLGGDGTVTSRIRVGWSLHPDRFVQQGGRVEVQFRDASLGAGEPDWEDGNSHALLLPGRATSAFLSPLRDGATYWIRLRALNDLGVPSDRDGEDWSVTLQHTVVGKTEPPPAPESFTVARLADGTRRFAWSLADPPADVTAGGGYRIRGVTGISGDWSAMAPLHGGLLTSSPWETNDLAAGSYSFAVKTVDSSGNESAEARFLQASLGSPRSRGVLISRIEQDLGFPGTRSDCFLDSDSRLKSVGLGGWEALEADWESLPGSWDAVLPGPEAIGYRVLLDLGADLSYLPQVTAEASQAPAVTMRSGEDGDDPEVSGAFAALGPVTARRYIEIDLEVTAAESPAEPLSLDLLTILLDGETSVEDLNDIDTSGADSERFERLGSGHFRLAAASLAVISQAQVTAIQNAGPGFTWELVDKAATAFGPPGLLAAEFKLYDASGSPADALIDATLKGPKSGS